MSLHLVLGAGGIGVATAAALTKLGHDVTLASRSGSDPNLPRVTPLALDVRDAAALFEAANGAATIVNALNPPNYTRWDRDWPPLAAAVLHAAECSGAGLVTVSNLYGYGKVDPPMTESTPLRPNGLKGETRVQLWRDALAAHEAGRVRVTELRASDYFGPGSRKGVSILQDYVIAPAAAGRRRQWLPLGNPAAPHSWTYLPDIGTFAATLATDDRSWGRAWHVPTAAPQSMSQVAASVAAIAERPAPTVRAIPRPLMTAARVVPLIRSLDETRHQFERPYVVDSSAAQEMFGQKPTEWNEALAATVRHLS